MITIHFSQCTDLPERDLADRRGISRAVIRRCTFWEEFLKSSDTLAGDLDVYTYDEHVLLIAQYLYRRHAIDTPIFIQHCNCRGDNAQQILTLDNESDFTEDLWHGFFPQRLPYLR